MCIRTNHERQLLLFAESMAITQKQSVNSHKAETHVSAGEQLICIILLPFNLQSLLVFIPGCSPLKGWSFYSGNLGGLSYSRFNFCEKITSSLNRVTTCEHSTFPLPTDSGTWSCFYLNAEHIIRVCSQGWGWGGHLPFLPHEDQKTEVLCSRWMWAPHVCNEKWVPGDPAGHQHIYKMISYIKSTTHIYCKGKHGFQKFSKLLRCPRVPAGPLRLLKIPHCHYDRWKTRRLPRK